MHIYLENIYSSQHHATRTLVFILYFGFNMTQYCKVKGTTPQVQI